MKKFICILLVFLFVVSFSACGGGDDNTTTETPYVEVDYGMEHPADVSNVEDFKCVCSIDNGESFIIEGEKAKELYSYVYNIEINCEETYDYFGEQKYVRLFFQSGETYYSGNNVGETRFYGDYWVYEDNSVTYSPGPHVSRVFGYQFPEETYEKILEMVQEQS